MVPVPMRGRRWASALLGVLLVAGVSLWAAPPARADESTKVLLLLDVSGSMNERISSGGSKFAAAKRALKRVAGALPAGTQVGLRVYGSEIAEPKEQDPKACTDTELVLPIGPLDRSRMDRAVDSFRAQGETPIAYSLGKSVDDLGGSGKRVLILISDGEESCAGDPCPAARKLAKAGVDLQFNAIGLDVGAKARKQLQCIADAGDGSYYDADDTAGLEEAVRKLTERALRPFEVSGTPVKGTLAEEGAPEIGPGQYRDRYDVSNRPRYYTINRTPGSLVTASIGTVVKPFRSYTIDRWELKLTTLDGAVCSSTTTGSGASGVASVVGGAVRSAYAPGPYSPSPGCENDPQLRWSLARQSLAGAANDVPVELLVSEEPPATNQDALPGPVEDYTGLAKAVRASKPARGTVGGSGYSNAPTIGAGTWTDTVTIGDAALYRVPLEYGQRLRATVEAPAGSKQQELSTDDAVTTYLSAFSPLRLEMTRRYATSTRDDPGRVSVASPQVRVRNHESELPGSNTALLTPDASTASVAGDYFVGVQLDPIGRELIGRPVSIRLSIAVDGTPSGQPEYATAVASASPSPTVSGPASPATTEAPTASPSSTPAAGSGLSAGRTFALGLAGGLGVAVLAAVGVWLLRRRQVRSRKNS
jgi:Ca-activated chloride channel family protein